MAQARGYKGRLILDFETEFKTPPATPAGLVMPFNSVSVRSDRAKNRASTITGRRDPVNPFDGNLSVSGDVVVPVDGIVFGYWLKAMFGNPATTDNLDGTFTHVWKTGDNQPSLVLEKEFPDIGVYAKHLGCKVSSFSMQVGGDGELTASLGIEGATEELGGTPYDASPTSLSLSRFNNFQASIKEGGATIATVVEASLSINFGLDTSVYTVGSQGTRGDIPEGMMEISGSIRALFDSMTLLDKAINSTESSLEITFDNGSEILTILVPELEYQRSTPGIDGPAGIYVDLPWQGYFDDNADGTSIKATLTNTKSSY